MFILVDQNEQATNAPVVQRLKRTFPNLSVENLAFGDVNIILDDGTILAIERKRARDFLGSIGDGRLFRQVEQMSNGAKWCCVIVEGSFEFSENDMCIVDGEETNWRGASVRGAMMAIQWAGCPILFTENFPSAVVDVIQFCSKPDVHYQALGRKRIVSFPPVELKEEIIAAFPGIGLKKARSLFEFAGAKNDGVSTLAEALCWATVLPMINPKGRPEGWGDKILLNFRAALGLKENEYLDIKEEKKKEKKK